MILCNLKTLKYNDIFKVGVKWKDHWKGQTVHVLRDVPIITKNSYKSYIFKGDMSDLSPITPYLVAKWQHDFNFVGQPLTATLLWIVEGRKKHGSNERFMSIFRKNQMNVLIWFKRVI